MKRRPFAPDTFAVVLLALGAVLMVFPSLRVAGTLAVVLAVIYWLLMAALRFTQR
jgi:hypothetical protein